MIIRKTKTEDIDKVLDLFEKARQFMNKNGNNNQWVDGYPQRHIIEQDILDGNSYVCLNNNSIIATFYFAVESDPTYLLIEEGSWLDDSPYGVIHRITTNGSVKGAATYCINWCIEKCGNIRVDTHEDNLPMHNLLIKCEFTQCGIIYIDNGDKRIAYQRVIIE